MSNVDEILAIDDNGNIKDGVSFQESGWKCFSGRETRSAWWGSRLLMMFLTIPPCSLLVLGLFFPASAIVVLPVPLIMILGINLYFIRYDVRRLHDRNMSGWLLLIGLIVGWVPIVGWAYSVFMFINLGCLDGTVGTNSYGIDPKGRKSMSDGVLIIERDSVEDRLQKLRELMNKEIISQEEYYVQRKRILSDL